MLTGGLGDKYLGVISFFYLVGLVSVGSLTPSCNLVLNLGKYYCFYNGYAVLLPSNDLYVCSLVDGAEGSAPVLLSATSVVGSGARRADFDALDFDFGLEAYYVLLGKREGSGIGFVFYGSLTFSHLIHSTGVLLR